MLIEKSVESRASTVTDELMLKYVPECFNMRQYDSLAHGFRKAFRLFVIDCFSSWQFIVNALLLYQYYSFWLHDPL